MTITLSWGKILYEMAIRYQHHPKENIIVAPLIGCIDYLQNDFQPNMICHRLAKLKWSSISNKCTLICIFKRTTGYAY